MKKKHQEGQGKELVMTLTLIQTVQQEATLQPKFMITNFISCIREFLCCWQYMRVFLNDIHIKQFNGHKCPPRRPLIHGFLDSILLASFQKHMTCAVVSINSCVEVMTILTIYAERERAMELQKLGNTEQHKLRYTK